MIDIGDIVKYNGYPYDGFYNYESMFIGNYITIGRSYKILNTCNVRRHDIQMIWYHILCDNNETYWLPSICFDFDMKEKYGLR